MHNQEELMRLNRQLLEEMPQYKASGAAFPKTWDDQWRLFRSLRNVRPPIPTDPAMLAAQDVLLSAQREEKGVVWAKDLPVTAGDPRLCLWKGDITRLGVDAIVNAANADLLGCFYPCHGCIDNAIHSAAGMQLRQACQELMEAQGHREKTGQAKLTAGYNLPCRYVLHTVGPIISGPLTRRDRNLLADCYRSCLTAAEEHGLESVAFCCISTGEFHFPNEEAAQIAVDTVKTFLSQTTTIKKVIFNVFKECDETIYRRILGPDQPIEDGAARS